MSHKLTNSQVEKARAAKSPKAYREIDDEVQPDVCDSFKPWDTATHEHLRANGNYHAADKCVQCGYPRHLHSEFSETGNESAP